MTDTPNERLDRLEAKIQDHENELVGLRGLVKALLLDSSWKDDELRNFIRDEARNPVARVEPDHAVSVANPLIEETEGIRQKNREGL